jgi:hypothetical protein
MICADASGAQGWFNLVLDVRPLSYPPVVVDFSPASAEPTALENTTVEFRAAFSDPEAREILYVWRLDNRTITGARSNSTTISFGFDSAGPHAVVVVATDFDGRTANVTWVVVVADVDRPPACKILVPGSYNHTMGTQVPLTAVGSDLDGTPVTFAWTVNGSAAGAGADFDATLINGTLNIGLLVSSGGLSTPCGVTLEGSAPPPPPPPPPTDGTNTSKPGGGFLPAPGIVLTIGGILVAMLGESRRRRAR